jgi:hypothetical protein
MPLAHETGCPKIVMLSDAAVAFLSPLKYRADAERRSCMLPLGGIYWEDEIPDFNALLKVPEHDRGLIYRLFSVRFRIWNGETLSEADQRFWEAARSRVPDYPLFRRLELSADDQRAQDEVERNAIEAFEVLFADADEIKVTENEQGLKSFSITFDLTKDQAAVAGKCPWWKRLWPWA